jgi:hypothetical protein
VGVLRGAAAALVVVGALIAASAGSAAAPSVSLTAERCESDGSGKTYVEMRLSVDGFAPNSSISATLEFAGEEVGPVELITDSSGHSVEFFLFEKNDDELEQTASKDDASAKLSSKNQSASTSVSAVTCPEGGGSLVSRCGDGGYRAFGYKNYGQCVRSSKAGERGKRK